MADSRGDSRAMPNDGRQDKTRPIPNSPPTPTPLNATTPEAGTVAWVDRPGFSEAVEAAARAFYELEYPKVVEGAHPDHHRWTWEGDGNTEAFKDIFREHARTTVAAAYPVIAAAVLAEARARIAGEAERERDDTAARTRLGFDYWDGVTRGKERAAGITASLARELTEGAE